MSIATFYSHETNWLASVLTVLRHGGTGVPTANIQIAQGTTYARTPRIEVDIEGDERASDQMAQIPGGEWYYSHRACDLVLRIVTNRTAATAQDHAGIRGRTRWLFTREAQRLVSPAVTLYQPLDVRDMGSNIFVRETDSAHEDVTELRHRIEYGVLPSVVPTV